MFDWINAILLLLIILGPYILFAAFMAFVVNYLVKRLKR